MNSGEVITVEALPVPNDPAAIALGLTYLGAMPSMSQHVQLDQAGNILFFIVDGNVYDGRGYLIANSSTDAAYSDGRLKRGTGEVVVAPVPSRCAQWYLFSSQTLPFPNADHQLGFSVLDMSSPNLNFPLTPDRWGAVLDGEGLLNAGYEYPFSAFDLNLNGEIPDAQSAFFKNGTVQLKVFRNVATARSFLLASSSYHLAKYELHTDQITYLGTQVIPHDPDPDLGYEANRAKGEIEAYCIGSQVRVGLSFNDAFSIIDPINPVHEVHLFMHFTTLNAASPLLAPVGTPITVLVGNISVQQPALDGLGQPVRTPSIGGVEFSPNGRYTYWTKTFMQSQPISTARLACWDWDQNAVIQLEGAPLQSFVDGKLELHVDPEGDGYSLYANGIYGVDQFGLGALFDPDNPSSSNWVSLVQGVDNLSKCLDPSLHFSSQPPPYDLYFLLNKQMFADPSIDMLASENCCLIIHQITGFTMPVVQATHQVWPGPESPFGDLAEIQVTGELRIPTGAIINASNMIFKFAPDARLVIERGAKLVSHNCTFTSACEQRWAGIRVEGNTANTYQDDDPNLPIAEEQGRLLLSDNSVVENAWIGVWCAREMVNHDPHPDYYGGWVRAASATFRNCVYGARVQNYHRMDGGTTEQANRNLFSGCAFVVDDDWSSWTPYWGIRLDDVRHVRVTNCRFENSAPWLFAPDRTGGGVQLMSATAYIQGNGDPDNAYFKNLQYGVQNTSGVYNPVWVTGMRFENNHIGIADFGSTWVNYSQNSFNVADQGNAPNARVGMYLWQTQLMTVEQNLLEGLNGENSVGIFFVGVTAPESAEVLADWVYIDNRIYNNTFNNLAAGCLVDRIHMGSGFSTSQAGLQMICGDYSDNKYDIAMLDKTLIRPNQGRLGQWAGNRFFNEADCLGNFDWVIDANWNVIPGGYEDLVIHYNRHDDPGMEVDVYCDQWPGFIDSRIDGSGTFLKTDDCDGGAYPIEFGSIGSHMVAYSQAKSLLSAAIATYEGTIDLGETTNLKDAIHASEPWMNSANLRDLLLAKHPLSDEVLVMVLKREVPLDNWHLTQILLQNSKLNPGVWSLVKELEILPPFFYSMVVQAQQGEGLSSKQLLEQEIVQRRLEMTEELTVLGHLYSMDTVGTHTDSLKKLLLYDKDKQFLLQQVEALIKLERYTEAQALLDGKLEGLNGKAVYEDLLAMQQSTSGNWKELSAADKGVLYAHAADGKAGAAQAAGILLSIDVDAPMPQVRFPNLTKSQRIRRYDRSTFALQETTLACYPNPSNASSFVTYPAEAVGMQLQVFDTKGAVVYSRILQGNGLTELDTRAFSEGLYQLAVPGLPLSVKLAVQH